MEIELTCPWCDEPVRATEDAFVAGAVCAGCRVILELAPDAGAADAATAAEPVLVPLAA